MPAPCPIDQSIGCSAVSFSIDTAINDTTTQAATYPAGASLLPVSLMSHVATSCAVPPNTQTLNA